MQRRTMTEFPLQSSRPYPMGTLTNGEALS
jgi:hypothetical protein